MNIEAVISKINPDDIALLGADHVRYVLAQANPLADLARRVADMWFANFLPEMNAYARIQNIVEGAVNA